MVIYRGVDGKPGYHQTDDIHDAVSFVEQMRNEEGVEHARIFRLEEVIFEYRPYYRVELTAAPAVGNGNGTAELGDAEQAQVGAGTDVAAGPAEDGGVQVADEAIDVAEADADADPDADVEDGDGEKAEAGAAKKGLFGR
ncbi:MAG: hypothetical protein AAF547_03880 [Actinomycetota bacterium]